ncbi:ABC transporter substrate-binding protein [Allostella humosa]|uniref:ABC transporter substrate-binding protein n=1 Tax=Stella humosa TaxID=94 RepID=UPI0011387F7E|nr:extracellular solute-binding protein [Stella humosa]BBK32583.1 ABC transporter substrate-binding protein [Stella humosa]
MTVAFWEHRVPGADEALRGVVEEWADENRIALRIDFITSVGAKHLLTARAEARARVGHDVMVHPGWQVAVHHRQLEPLDDIVAEVEATHGPYDEAASFLARVDGRWRGLPAPSGSHAFPMVSRLDLLKQHAGVDLQEVFPPAGVSRQADRVATWSWEAFLVHAGRLRQAGRPFAAAIGPGGDAQNWLAPLFLSFGAVLVNARGEIGVDSDQMRNALEYLIRLAEQMPREVEGWDDRGNNDWLAEDRAAVIVNRPSPWAMARQGKASLAQQLWHHDMPGGPSGRFRAVMPHFLGIWDFARNKPAARALLRHLADRDVVRRMVAASQGYDLPLLRPLLDGPTWAEAGPPKGTVFNYPVRGDEAMITAGYPAPPAIAATIYNQGMIGRLASRVTREGWAVEKAVAWAREELETYRPG